MRLAGRGTVALALAALFAGACSPQPPVEEAVAEEEPAPPPPPPAHPTLGSLDAPVHVIMYGGFQDPFSKRFHAETLPAIRRDFVEPGRVAFEFRNLPLSFHDRGYVSALASECAYEQGEVPFWSYFDALMTTTERLELAHLRSTAGEAGLDVEAFDVCMAAHDHTQPDSVVSPANPVDEDLLHARAAGASGTPTFFINGTRFVGAQPYEAFAERIEELLAGGAGR